MSQIWLAVQSGAVGSIFLFFVFCFGAACVLARVGVVLMVAPTLQATGELLNEGCPTTGVPHESLLKGSFTQY